MTEDQKVLKNISNKIKRIAKRDVDKVENEATRGLLKELLEHVSVMLASASTPNENTKEKDSA